MKLTDWLFVLIGIGGLVAVRMVEGELFYDPFLKYFHDANRNLQFPEFDWWKLIMYHVFRFFLNLLFSAVVLHAFFDNKMWTAQGLFLIVLVFFITLPIYLFCLHTKLDIGYLFTFYMRRFVIQPVILLLIIPIFFYRKMLKNKI